MKDDDRRVDSARAEEVVSCSIHQGAMSTSWVSCRRCFGEAPKNAPGPNVSWDSYETFGTAAIRVSGNGPERCYRLWDRKRLGRCPVDSMMFCPCSLMSCAPPNR